MIAGQIADTHCSQEYTVDRIESATHRYKARVRPRQGQAEVTAWMEDYVLPAIEELWNRPRFKELAAWANVHLAPGSTAPERECVELVEKALVTEAKALLRLSKHRVVAKNFAANNPPISRVIDETVEISDQDPNVKPVRRTMGLVDEAAMFRGQVEWIADHRWSLVCLDDFFGPAGDIAGRVRGHKQDVQAKAAPTDSGRRFPVDPALAPFFNPKLLPLGDLVTRCMMARLDEYVSCIERFRGCVHRALPESGAQMPRAKQEEDQAWTGFQGHIYKLRELCRSGKGSLLREAAATLAQVRLAFSPGQLVWSWLKSAGFRARAAELRNDLLHWEGNNALDRVAAALREIRHLYRGREEDSDFEEAITQGGLVLVESPPTMFWRKKEIKVDWALFSECWKFWLILAKQARSGGSVTPAHLGLAPESSRSTFYNRKKRAADCVRQQAADLAGAIGKGNLPVSFKWTSENQQVTVVPRRYRDPATVQDRPAMKKGRGTGGSK